MLSYLVFLLIEIYNAGLLSLLGFDLLLVVD